MALCKIHRSTYAIAITVSILSYLNITHSLQPDLLPVSSSANCSALTSCSQCNLHYKHSNCIWRQSECHKLERNELPVPQRSIVCPPEVHDFNPKSGPLAGGTVLYIDGFNFGISTSGDNTDENMMSVYLGNRKCKVLSRTNLKAQCKIEEALPDSDQNILGMVNFTIEVKYFERFDFGYYIDGKARAIPFYFAEPEVYGIYPSYGPFKGGSFVMVYGKNLDIGGYGANVFFGGYKCKTFRLCGSMIICRTSEVVSVSSQDVDLLLPVNVSIDSWQKILTERVPHPMSHDGRPEPDLFDSYKNSPVLDLNFMDFAEEIDHFLTRGLKLQLESSFQYLPNPEVEKLTNLVTVDSGGTSLQFKGRHLGSSKYPVMGIFTNVNSNDHHGYYHLPALQMLCTAHTEETILDCPLPPFTRDMGIRDFFNQTLLYVLKFDGFTNDSSFNIEVFPDPGFNKSVKVLPGKERILEFTGWNLNPALPYKIFMKTPTNLSIPCDVEPRIDERERHLWCRINRPPEMMSRYTDSDLEVDISVGNSLNFQPGYVRFVDDPKPPVETGKKLLWAWVAFPVCGVIVISVLLYKWYRNRSVTKFPPETVFGNWTEELEGIFSRNSSETRGFPSLFSTLLDRSMLIDPSQLIVDHRLGSGNYGTVYKAVYESPTESETEETSQVEVAVKVQNRDSGMFHEFIGEAQVMLEFNHPNVMYLVGVTLDENRKPAIVLPFMDGLDLKSYVTNKDLKVEDFLCFGLQIANGMIYLSQLNIIHRDLALRNCMVQRGNPCHVRVADFGLTRETTQNYYTRSRDALPFLWMAPEALKRFRFSIKSDVYSYGITLWELMTRGKTPFEFFTADELIEHLEGGNRLPMPYGCPDLIYTIMGKCWMHDPDDRPTFIEIYDELGRAIDRIDNLENAEAHRYENSFFTRYSRNREYIFDYRQQRTRDILNQVEESILRHKIGTVFDPSREFREEHVTSGSVNE